MTVPTTSKLSLATGSPIERARKGLFLINGGILTLMGTVAMLSDLLAYRTGMGPMGKHLFNAPYAVSFFDLHGLTALFGLLLLAMAWPDPKRGWHIAAAVFHLFLAGGIVIFWQGAVAWGVVQAEVGALVLHAVFASAHFLLYGLVKKLASP